MAFFLLDRQAPLSSVGISSCTVEDAICRCCLENNLGNVITTVHLSFQALHQKADAYASKLRGDILFASCGKVLKTKKKKQKTGVDHWL